MPNRPQLPTQNLTTELMRVEAEMVRQQAAFERKRWLCLGLLHYLHGLAQHANDEIQRAQGFHVKHEWRG